MITISKQSKTYKFYDFLSKIFLFQNVTPFRCGEIDTFRDICTFARVTLLYLFFSFPLFIGFFATIFYSIYSLFHSLFTLTISPTTAILSFIACVAIGLGTIVGGIILLITGYEKVSDKVGENTFISLISESISSKHNKFCQILKVVDESEEKKGE